MAQNGDCSINSLSLVQSENCDQQPVSSSSSSFYSSSSSSSPPPPSSSSKKPNSSEILLSKNEDLNCLLIASFNQNFGSNGKLDNKQLDKVIGLENSCERSDGELSSSRSSSKHTNDAEDGKREQESSARSSSSHHSKHHHKKEHKKSHYHHHHHKCEKKHRCRKHRSKENPDGEEEPEEKNRNDKERHKSRTKTSSRSRSPSSARSSNRHKKTRSRSKEDDDRRSNEYGSTTQRYFSANIDENRHQHQSHHHRKKHKSSDGGGSSCGDEIDKKRLLAIAQQKVRKMIEDGSLSEVYNVNEQSLKDLERMTSKRTIEDCTKLCENLADTIQSERTKDKKSFADEDEMKKKKMESEKWKKSLESDKLIERRNRFEAIEPRREIKIDVKDFITIAPRTAKEIKESFPVSSGISHQWKTVDEDEHKKRKEEKRKSKKKKEDEEELSKKSNRTLEEDEVEKFLNQIADNHDKEGEIDIGVIMSQRAGALKMLQKDPTNAVALRQLQQANEMLQKWEQKKAEHFSREFEEPILPPVSLWPKKDMLKAAPPIEGGIGMSLLKKMGWEPGQGLGRNNEGKVDPLMLELKFDTKGLASREEGDRRWKKTKLQPQLMKPLRVDMHRRNGIVQPMNEFVSSSSGLLPLPSTSTTNQAAPLAISCTQNEILDHINNSMMRGLHPVSILQELCLKKRFSTPVYQVIHEAGPAHKPNFLMKCMVNNVEYIPTFSSTNKKQAKAVAAQICLQALSDFAGLPM